MNSLILPNLMLNCNYFKIATDTDIFDEESENFISIFFDLSDIVSRRY